MSEWTALQAPGWARPPRARQYHYFAGLESACGRWTMGRGAHFPTEAVPLSLRCARCEWAAFGRPIRHRSRHAAAAAVPGELALAVARRLVRGRPSAETVTVSVALLRRLIKVAGEAAAARAGERGITNQRADGGPDDDGTKRALTNPSDGLEAKERAPAAGDAGAELRSDRGGNP